MGKGWKLINGILRIRELGLQNGLYLKQTGHCKTEGSALQIRYCGVSTEFLHFCLTAILCPLPGQLLNVRSGGLKWVKYLHRHTYTCLWTIPSRSFQTKSSQSILKIHKMQIPFITWNASGKKTKEEKQPEVRIFKVWNVPKLEKCLNLQWWKCTKWNTSVLKQLMFLGQIKFPSSILMQNYVLWNGKWLKIYQIKSKHWKAFLMARSN